MDIHTLPTMSSQIPIKGAVPTEKELLQGFKNCSYAVDNMMMSGAFSDYVCLFVKAYCEDHVLRFSGYYSTDLRVLNEKLLKQQSEPFMSPLIAINREEDSLTTAIDTTVETLDGLIDDIEIFDKYLAIQSYSRGEKIYMDTFIQMDDFDECFDTDHVPFMLEG